MFEKMLEMQKSTYLIFLLFNRLFYDEISLQNINSAYHIKIYLLFSK
jgi:hypothetical protein